MARKTEGSCKPRKLADGTWAFDIRFQIHGKREPLVLHERPNCDCGCGGGWNKASANTELGNILARVRAGVWERPQPPETLVAFGDCDDPPLFVEFSKWWLDQKRAGIFGDRELSKNTMRDYRNRVRHLNAFFGRYPVDQIDSPLCVDFKAQLLLTAQEQREAMEAGAKLKDRQGRPLRPLAAASVHKVIACLKAILDEAVEEDFLPHNPATGRRMKVKVPKPKRTFLEMEELAYLVDAAADQDSAMLTTAAPEGAGKTAKAVAGLASKGLGVSQIAEELGLAKPSITYHLRNLGAQIGRGYVGRRVICELLGRGGPRISELEAMLIGEARVHDPEGARIRIPDAKTEAGVRIVEMSPVLAEVVVEHLDRLRRLGHPTGPKDYLVPNLRGGRLTHKRIGQIIREAAELASQRLEKRGLPPLPHTTAHTLRRTYISIALIANNYDVKYVMSQVGHADSTMTMDVYAQLETRMKRSHGKNFDKLVREARELVKGLPMDLPESAEHSPAQSSKATRQT